jgi:hypothetical protein
MRSRFVTAVWVAACVASLVCLASPASAGLGLRAGASLSPDDFLVGLQFRSHPIAQDLRIVPSVEAGFGDDTWIGGNGDLHYVFHSKSDLRPYAGGGVTLNWFDSTSDLRLGGSLLGGIYVGKTIVLEAKLGLGDVPDWKFVLCFGR